MNRYYLLCLLLLCSTSSLMKVNAQDSLIGLPQKYLSVIRKKLTYFDDKLDKAATQQLIKMERKEEKIIRKIARKDSLQAIIMLEEVKTKYTRLKSGLEGNSNIKKIPYIPYIDSLKTSLRFIDQIQNAQFLDMIEKSPLHRCMDAVEHLEAKLAHAEKINAFVNERKRSLQKKLDELGMVKELKPINKQVYYYADRLRMYKEFMQDKGKIEKEAMNVLRRLPIYQQFIRKHSRLASLFRLPPLNNSSNSIDANLLMNELAGLQTRDMIQQELGRTITMGGPNTSQMLKQNIHEARNHLEKLKEKPGASAYNNDESEMSDFKVNQERNRSFFQRLEYGFNVQSVRANGLLPTRSDIGLSLGYKLNQKNLVGFGCAYSLGWGSDIRHLQLSHQGVGLRSFIDVAIAGSIYVSGGYEQHYRSAFKNVEELKSRNQWEAQGLLGLTKKFQLRSKLKGYQTKVLMV